SGKWQDYILRLTQATRKRIPECARFLQQLPRPAGQPLSHLSGKWQDYILRLTQATRKRIPECARFLQQLPRPAGQPLSHLSGIELLQF
ncbi:MAG: hypothetical protein KBB26_08090, partial [Candidatus Omnitrophica bacterium]|nr:hypothetical protein [Candidatus Omnitrophota bacterium]